MEMTNLLSVPSQLTSHSRTCSDNKLNRLSYSTFDSQSCPNTLDLSMSEDTMSRCSLEQGNGYFFKKNGGKLECSVGQQITTQAVKLKRTEKEKVNEKQIMELYQIEIKTEMLANKEREQRKELKKLRKMYQQKIDELRNKEQQERAKESAYHSNIQKCKVNEDQLLQEKQKLLQRIFELQRGIQQLQLNLKASFSQKEVLWNKIELIEGNCQCGYQSDVRSKDPCADRVEQIIGQAQEHQLINKEMMILDKTIAEKTRTAESKGDFQQILKLYELRKGYQKRKEDILVEKQTQKLEKIISKLNRIIINNYRKINVLSCSKVYEHCELKEPILNSEVDYQDPFDKNESTCESFFAKTIAQTCQNSQGFDLFATTISRRQNQQEKWINIKEATSQLIDRHTIKGHESYYENIEELLLSLFDLFETKAEQSQYLCLVQTFLTEMNKVIINKAKNNSNKIKQLMSIVNKPNRPAVRKDNMMK